MDTDVFLRYESEVRSYCRSFPTVFSKAKGSYLEDKNGRRYLDFFSGAGALNYGHNPDFIQGKLINYLQNDGIMHALDMYTSAKEEFISALQNWILAPRGLDYRIQFTGPTGTNAVEAALKIARKVKNRQNVFAFQGGYHGMTLGSLACTGNSYLRQAANVTLPNVTFMPYPFGAMGRIDTIAYIDAVLSDPSSGIDKPAAMLLETVQAEGGVVVASADWLRQLRALCTRHDILMIVDDIQVGCGRTGSFFSFERADIKPDIITLSKSISGYGLPMAIVLLAPEIDKWKPGEHNGTFRGNQLAFVAASAALELWTNSSLENEIARKSNLIENGLREIVAASGAPLELRGIGLIWGLDFTELGDSDLIDHVLSTCFQHGLIVESAGRNGQVMKLLPPLVASDEELHSGLGIIRAAILASLSQVAEPNSVAQMQ